MLSFKQYITEGPNLAPAELYKYQWRVDLFVDKIKKGDPLTLVKGGDVVLTHTPEVLSDIISKTRPGKIVLTGADGNTYKLSDFAKTPEFGGGGGTGAGSKLTKMTESAQAVFAQARWMGPSEYSPEDIATAYKLANVDEGLIAIQNELPEVWRDSSIIGAEALYSKFGNKPYQFHRGSSWVTRLENTFKKLNRAEKHFANLNKWSPADIYMVSPAGANIKFELAKNLVELNGILTNALKTKDIIGVSLKLLKKKAKMTYYNFESKKKIIEFDHYTTGTKGFFSGKDIYIYFTENGKIQFRTFPETFQGEIKGKNANQGKLSYGPIQTILRQLKLPALSDNKKLRKMLEQGDDMTYHAFYSNYTRYAKDPKKESYADFVNMCKEKGTSWAFSKSIGCEIIDIITKHKAETDFVTACIQYASSSSELSAPFLKLE